VAQVAVCSQINTKHINTVWGRAYSCWMLNWWCITWPVGFKRLIISTPKKNPALMIFKLHRTNPSIKNKNFYFFPELCIAAIPTFLIFIELNYILRIIIIIIINVKMRSHIFLQKCMLLTSCQLFCITCRWHGRPKHVVGITQFWKQYKSLPAIDGSAQCSSALETVKWVQGLSYSTFGLRC